MYVCNSSKELLDTLRQCLKLAERRRDDPSNRQKDTAFYKGEVYAYRHAIEVCEVLVLNDEEASK